MRIIDISMEIHPEMPTYMGRENIRPKREVNRKMPPDNVNDTSIFMNLHTGTHLDSPLHMIEAAKDTTTLPLDRLITPARVIDVTEAEGSVHRHHLKKHDIPAGTFLLL